MPDFVLQPGDVYGFGTAPLSEFALQATGRHAALKVLGSNKNYIVVAALDGIWDVPPSLRDTRRCKILRQHRFLTAGKLAVWGIPCEWWEPSDLGGMTLLGKLPVTGDEAQLAADVFELRPGSSFSTMTAVNNAAEGEWRWANDRAALLAEHAQTQARDAARRAAEEERQRTRLRGLTWEILLGETPFARWTESPPFPPETFTRAARDTVHDTCRALQALGAKPRRTAVRKLLRDCVEWFNKADEQAGGVIETEEREDIFAVLEEMAHVARQRSLVEEFGSWRNW